MVNRNVELKHDGNKTKLAVSNCVDLTETFINELEETLTHESDRTISDSQETTFTASQMDYTYEEAPASDDSVTEQKLLAQSSDRDKRNKDKNSKGKDEETITVTDDDEILYIRSCSRNDSSGSIRCNLCIVWFHTECVGISDIDSVGAWVCADCRLLPRTVQVLETQMQIMIKSTEKILKL